MLNVQECVLVYQDLILTLIYVDMVLISMMFLYSFACCMENQALINMKKVLTCRA